MISEMVRVSLKKNFYPTPHNFFGGVPKILVNDVIPQLF